MSESILPVHRSSRSEALKKVLEGKFESSLESLVTGKTPKDAVYTRKGRGGKSFDYIQGYWVVEQLNALFDYNWDWDIIDQEIGKKQIWVKGRLTIRILREGGDTTVINKTSYGGADIKFLRDGGEIIDIADDLKAASTDALKKAASWLGLAADLYKGDDASEEGTKDQSILNALYMRGSQLGWTEEGTREWIKKESQGKSLEELTQTNVNRLLGRLVQLTQNNSTNKEKVNS